LTTFGKGKVESGVGHAQKTPLKGLRFESLDEAQGYLDRWEERWADTRTHATTERQGAPSWIGRHMYIPLDALHGRLVDPRTGQLLREHLRQKRGEHRIKDEDHPQQTPLGSRQLLCRA
jgi:hypothetical protein